MFLKQFVWRRHFFLLAGFLLLLLLVAVSAVRRDPHTAVAAPQETPTTMVDQDVTSYTLAHPRFLWRTASVCDEVPNVTNRISDTAVPEDPELISRLFVTGGNSRVIWSENAPRPPGSCNPYKFLSNIVGDGEYVYWADESGLVRQSVEANPADEPQVVSTAVKSSHNSNKVLLAITDDYIYALIYPTPISSQLLRLSKSTLTADPAFSILGYGTQLAADEDNVYWLFSGTLWRANYEQGAGWDVASIATNVTSFASSTFYLFIARGDNIVRYNKLGGSTTAPLYTSSSPNAPSIYSVVHSQAITGEIFFLESREGQACPECFIEYTQVLFRLGASGGTAVPLYTRTIPLTLNVFNLQAADGYVYWQEDDTIRRLTQNADALPQTNIIIQRIEVTQGTQDISNSVPLIGGRRTFVRVFGLGQGQDVPNVTAYLYRVNPTTLETIGDPLMPMNSTGGTHNVVHPVHVPLLLDNSFVYELPLSWVQTGQPLRLKAVVNPFNNPLESNPNDNTAVTKTFTPIPSARLEAEFYALLYTFTPSNTVQGPRHEKDIDQTFSYIRRTYPLASDPGNYQTPGFRPNVRWVTFPRLEKLLNQTDPYCADFDPGDPNDPDKPNERASCAATYVLDTLRAWQERDEDADGTAYIYYGWMADTAGFGRGLGGGGAAVGPTGDSTFGWDFDGAYTDWYTAHEFAHAIGRQHPSQGNECGHSDDDDDYPYLDSAIGPYNGQNNIVGATVWGFDMGDAYFGIPRQGLPSFQWRDFMGYCDFQWVSDYTYLGLYEDIPDWVDGVADVMPRQAQAPIADALVIYGSLFPETGVAKLSFVQRTSVNNAPPITPGAFAIRLLDSQNQVLASHPFTPDVPEDHALLSFGQAVPYVPNTAVIQIVELATNKVWGDTAVSANAPTVSNVTISANTNPVTGTVTVNWTASDSDNDPLTADILYSQDGGATFQPYLIGVSGQSTQVDTSYLGGGSTIFRVVASDGVNIAQADSAPFTMANKAPTPAIHNPGDGAHVSWGQLINFIGEARDLQDGTVDAANLHWSNQYGSLGTGSILPISELPVGENHITLTATNSKGVSASTTITVIVGDGWGAPVADLQVGPNPVGWHVAAGEDALQSSEVHLYNIGEGSLTWTASENADWLSLSSSSGSTPATVIFTADPAGLEADKSYVTQVTFMYEDGNGQSQTLEVPVSLGIGDVRNNPPQRIRVNSWSAYLPFIHR